MTRYVKSGTVNTVQEINSELEKIAEAQEDFLARSGEAPNEMLNNVDMNNYELINYPDTLSPEGLVKRKELPSFVMIEGVLTFASSEESIILTAGQVVVDFPTLTTASCSFYITGKDTDNGRLAIGTDYSVTDSLQITLTDSYPSGTKITAVQVQGTTS